MSVAWKKLGFALFLPFLAGSLGSLATAESIPTWYVTLNKPFFTPPNWVFGPVWTLLYVLMGLAYYLVLKEKKVGDLIPTTAAEKLFIIQILLNLGWSFVFFGMRSPFWGLVVIVLLDIFVVATVQTFYRINKIAGVLLFPYLVWILYASALNLAIVVMN